MMPMDALNIEEIFYKDNETGELKKLGRPINYSLTCEAGCIPTLTTDIALTDFGEKVIMSEETSCISVADIQPIFEVGDVVEIKSWNEMEKEFGLTDLGSINCREGFVVSMRYLCGKIFKIANVEENWVVKLEDCDDDWVISTDMIKHVNKKKNNNLDIGNLYPTDVSIDIGDMKVDFEKLLEERIEKKKKERGKDMELLRMYEKQAISVIRNAIKEEVERRKNAEPLVKEFKQLTERFETELEALFATQPIGYEVLSEKCSDNMFKYGVSYKYENQIDLEVGEEYEKYREELVMKLDEIRAQLELIEESVTDNSYYEKLSILRAYGIVDKNGKLNKYKLPAKNAENFSDETVTPEPKKRGRKPNNTTQQ